MTKKLLALGLSLTMALSLAACGGNSGSSASGSSSNTDASTSQADASASTGDTSTAAGDYGDFASSLVDEGKLIMSTNAQFPAGGAEQRRRRDAGRPQLQRGPGSGHGFL